MRGHQQLDRDQQVTLIEGVREKAVRQMRENRTVTLLAIFILLIFIGSSISSSLGYQKYNSQISAVLVYSGRVDVLKQSLNSFLSQESSDFSKIIIVYDGNSTNDLKQQIKLSSEAYVIKNKVEWIVTDTLIGEIAAVDLGLSKVTTQFVFLAVGTWNYVQHGFAKSAIASLRFDRHISQVMIKKFQGVQSEKIQFIDTTLAGFNFQPSMHRMKNYKLIEGGFTNLTKNATYSMASGPAQSIISSFFLKHGFKIVSLGKEYVQAIRKNNFSYKTFQFKNQYLYKRFWHMKQQDRTECVINLQMNKIFREQHGVRRQTKRQIGNVIKLDKKQSNLSEIIELGIDKYVQVGSKFDFMKLTTKKGYDNITTLYPKSLHFEEKKFNEQKLPQKPLENVTFNNFKTMQDLDEYLSNTNNSLNFTGQSTQIKLAAKLLKQPQNVKNLEAEYFYYNQKYRLDQVKKQLSICVFMQGFNVHSRSKMVSTLASINSQNYSNYRAVFVADEDEDFSKAKFFDIAKSFNNKLINRLTVAAHNEDVLGNSGNHFLRMKQYCKQSEVVITINGNSTLIGRQVFNVINAVYQNQSKQAWMTFFSVVKSEEQNLVLTQSFDSISPRDKGTETDQFLIAFRYQMINLIPIEQVIEFISNTETQYLRPSFYESESNRFHIYPLIQLCNRDRIISISAPVYLYKQLDPITNQKCWFQKSEWIKSKSLLKYPLKQVKALNMTTKIDTTKSPSPKSVKKVQQSYKQYLNCLQYQKGLKKQSKVSPIKNFNTFLNDSVSVMRTPNYFIGTIQVNKIDPLPFCFIIWSGDENSKKKSELIIESIRKQDYKNYTIIKVMEIGADVKNEISSQKNNKKWQSLFQVGLLTQSYYSYHKMIFSTCTENSLLMFPNSPLKLGYLYEMNNLHQRENSWMTYSLNGQYVQIHTFYYRVYDLIHNNDFYKTNQLFLEKGDQQLQALAILELCPKYSSRIPLQQVYQNPLVLFESNELIYLRASYENSQQYERQPYQELRQLHQDYQVVLQEIDIQINLLHKNKEYLSRPNINSHLDKLNLLQAYEYEMLPYLPDNHILNIREYEYLDSKYQIGKYMTGEYTNMTTRFCVTVFGRNNTESNRYIKNLKSIIMQNYSNYHIVFMDDVSDDKTLEHSVEYLRKAGFPRNKVTYVKNLQRTFATYNIINSAFNFCGEDDVQVRLDGDDSLVGRNAFGLINAVYLNNPQYWIVYTSYKTSQFNYGMSSEIQREEQMVNCEGGRRRFHFIGPLATWRVKVIRSIPLKYHQVQYGGWLNTLYDDALQFPFFQLSTIKRIKYIPYFAYNYNANYGSNDNSDKQKIKDRIALFEYVVTLDPLKPMLDLNDSRTKNVEVASILKSNWGKVFTTL